MGSDVARRNLKRWERMLKTLHSMGEVKLDELKLIKSSAAVIRSNQQFKNLTNWASKLGVQNMMVSQAHFNLGRMAVKLLDKHEKIRKMNVYGRWNKLFKGILAKQDLLSKVKTLNILRWELITLKLMQSRPIQHRVKDLFAPKRK